MRSSWRFSGRCSAFSSDAIARGLLKLRLGVFVLKELIRRQHGDAVPRTNLMAQRAADATGEVDGADLERLLVPRAGDCADAIDRADDQARLAARAHVFIEQGQNFGEL